MKKSEVIDYLEEVRKRIEIPVYESKNIPESLYEEYFNYFIKTIQEKETHCIFEIETELERKVLSILAYDILLKGYSVRVEDKKGTIKVFYKNEDIEKDIEHLIIIL